ncbi:unnamed protein product [Medioppia subpectinata]|uniref:E3 ubiquitin ligase complex SCF subunit n=1 Tax=Medioppia subpectinata TaxID=1979941 RepID=A0A7R9KKY8_9ACAR|nr:unnamed protein product [Medioppia subpectinata]CAG2105393.1 unnamed protein product [Medioppia subpectinata]
MMILPNDGEARTVRLDVAKKSITVKSLIENTTNCSKPVPLPTVSAKILDKVLEYLNYHIEDPVEEIDSDDEDNGDAEKSDDICVWDQNFMKGMNRETLFELLLAANYLDIKGLLDLGCKTAANEIRGKTADEVQELWGIECDLPEEEVSRLKKENAWAEEK